MSLETLILLMIFVLLPLLQQLLRGRASPEEQPQPPRPRPPQRPVPAPRRGTADATEMAEPPPPLPPARAPAEPPRRLRAQPLEPVSRPEPRRAGPRRVGPRLGAPRDLRGAIVMMTILGPCRANGPYEAP